MGVALHTKSKSFEIGTASFLTSFFDTIEVRLPNKLFKKRFPIIKSELYSGQLANTRLDGAKRELEQIREELKQFSPDKIIWDKTDRSKLPPWGNNISPDIVNLSNYFVTSDGQDLFDVLLKAIDCADAERSDIRIK